MAALTKTPSGTWKATIRRVGWPTAAKMFRTKRDAEDWARRTEDEMVRGVFIQRAPSEKTTVADALARYAKEIVPLKKATTQRREGARLRELTSHFGKYSLAAVIGTSWGFIEQAWRALGGVQNTLSAADLDSVKQVARDTVATTVLNGLDAAASNTLEFSTVNLMALASMGQKMVIVAHSQGNMFAKELYARTQMAVPNQYNVNGYEIARQFQVVNVGTPATTSDTGKYVTAVQDIVIDLLARLLSTLALTSQPALPNFNSGLATYAYDPLGHDFLNVYLNDQLGLEGRVMDLAQQAANDAGSFGNDNPEGPLQITGASNNGSATYTVTAPDGTTSVVTVLRGVTPTEVFHPTCDILQEGTYHIQADITAPVDPSSTQPWYAAFVVLNLPRLGPSKLEALYSAFWFGYTGETPMSTSVGAMDVVLTKDVGSGGFDERIYFYRQQ